MSRAFSLSFSRGRGSIGCGLASLMMLVGAGCSQTLPYIPGRVEPTKSTASAKPTPAAPVSIEAQLEKAPPPGQTVMIGVPNAASSFRIVLMGKDAEILMKHLQVQKNAYDRKLGKSFSCYPKKMVPDPDSSPSPKSSDPFFVPVCEFEVMFPSGRLNGLPEDVDPINEEGIPVLMAEEMTLENQKRVERKENFFMKFPSNGHVILQVFAQNAQTLFESIQPKASRDSGPILSGEKYPYTIGEKRIGDQVACFVEPPNEVHKDASWYYCEIFLDLSTGLAMPANLQYL